MDLIGNLSDRLFSPSDIIADFGRHSPAVMAAFGPLAETPTEIKSKVEEYLADFLLRARRLPQFTAEEARRLVHHEASWDKIIVGELCQFPEKYEPAICDIRTRIYRQEQPGRGPVKDRALYCLARLARLYRLEAERQHGIPDGAFDPRKHLPARPAAKN